ncbi:DUF3558 domain-containing protein [Nocardia zapadnayensis]|uniref:DUF3558 domain-containing protein n=1 Tax=Nocardia rhamnosiphila TaxID=426716 RepID=UPI002247C801|nr:DUF3558 domain-containing protein [Nocardia zapadnayensis]MCX0270643.1 DUF3558 domain-containing protein [Nocardia zapadnayensis]
MAAVVALAGALLAVSGCDAATDGSAAPVTTTDAAAATEALWDPCTQISDDMLRQVGVDPATRDNTISGVENVEGWKLCSWKDKLARENYALGVWATTHTIEESKQDGNNVDFFDISVGGRHGVQFRRAYDKRDEVCYLSFPANGQTVDISVYKAYSTIGLEDDRPPCEIAAAAAEVLVPIIPE